MPYNVTSDEGCHNETTLGELTGHGAVINILNNSRQFELARYRGAVIKRVDYRIFVKSAGVIFVICIFLTFFLYKSVSIVDNLWSMKENEYQHVDDNITQEVYVKCVTIKLPDLKW